MKVHILSSQDGDWEGLFVDGKLVSEGHVLGEGNSQMFMLEMAEKYGFKGDDVLSLEVNDSDDEMLQTTGGFPDKLKDLSGNY